MGALQELSLLTGIISKTALPGTKITTRNNLKVNLLHFPVCFYILQTTHAHSRW